MNLDGFPWPIMGERKTPPIWDDDHFIVDSERFEILAYSDSESAWSPELTALHEKEASTSHPDRYRLTDNGDRLDETDPGPQQADHSGCWLLQRFSR